MTLILDKDNPLGTKVQTQSGWKARIICTDLKGGPFPIVALVEQQNGDEHIMRFAASGAYAAHSSGGAYDLINAPEEVEFDIWQDIDGRYFLNLAGCGRHARENCHMTQFARIKVRKGEGL